MRPPTIQEFIKDQLMSSKTVYFSPNLVDFGPFCDVKTECSLELAVAAIDAWRRPQLQLLEQKPDSLPYIKVQFDLFSSCIFTIHASESGCYQLLRLSGHKIRPPSESQATDTPVSRPHTNRTQESIDSVENFNPSDIRQYGTSFSCTDFWSNLDGPPKVWQEPPMRNQSVNSPNLLSRENLFEKKKWNLNLLSNERILANLTKEVNNRPIISNFEKRGEVESAQRHLFPSYEDKCDVDELENRAEGDDYEVSLSRTSSSSLGDKMANLFMDSTDEVEERSNPYPFYEIGRRNGFATLHPDTFFRAHSISTELLNESSQIPTGSSENQRQCCHVTETVNLAKNEILQVIGPMGLDIHKISVEADCKIALLPITNDMLNARGKDYLSFHTFKLTGERTNVLHAKNLLRRALLEIRSK